MRVLVTPPPGSLRSPLRQTPLLQTRALFGVWTLSVAIASCEEYTCVDTATCSFEDDAGTRLHDADVNLVSPEAGVGVQSHPDASHPHDTEAPDDADANTPDPNEKDADAYTPGPNGKETEQDPSATSPASSTSSDRVNVSSQTSDYTLASETTTASEATPGSTTASIDSITISDTPTPDVTSELSSASDYAASESSDSTSSTSATSSDTTPPVDCTTDPDTVPIDATGVVLAACNNAGINGEWYCFDDGVNPSGCTENSVPFDAARSGMCLTGNTTLDENFEAWGAGIGLTLNSDLAWNATSRDVIGFKIGMTGSSGGVPLRLSFGNTADSSDVPPTIDLPQPDEYYVLFEDAHIPEWAEDNAGDPADPTSLYYVHLVIAGGTENANYDFCVTELTPIFDQ